MPNTLIREGYLDSDRVSALSDFDDRVFFRLLLAADDAGRTDGRTDKLRSALFPTRETVRGADVAKAITDLGDAGLITRWEWDGKPVIQIMRWQRRSGAQFSKFPDRAGSFRIAWVKVETRDGEHAFSSTSLPQSDRRVTEPIDNPFGGVSEKPTETKTYSDTKTETEDAPHARDLEGNAVPPHVLRTPAFTVAWQRWFTYQHERYHGFHVLTQERQLAELKRLGVAQALAVIDSSITKGAKQLCFPDQKRNGETQPSAPKTRKFCS